MNDVILNKSDVTLYINNVTPLDNTDDTSYTNSVTQTKHMSHFTLMKHTHQKYATLHINYVTLYKSDVTSYRNNVTLTKRCHTVH